MKEFIERIGAVRLAIAILLIMSLLSVLLGYREGLAPILLGGFLVTALIGLAEIVDAIRESLPQRQTIHINCDAEVMKRLLNDARQRLLTELQAKPLAEEAHHGSCCQKCNNCSDTAEVPEAETPQEDEAEATEAESETADNTEADSEVEESREEDKTLHRPLTEAPEDGTLVYLHTMGEGKNIVPTAYAGAYHSQALREGRIYRSKEDALVHLYGDHYSTLKPEGEIGRGTLLRELDNYSQTTHNQMKQEQIKALQERMQSYIGTKHIRAVEMTRGEYNKLRGWQVPSDENPDDYGYLVEYQNDSPANVKGFNGYISWSPMKPFEEAYKVANDWRDRANIELDELRVKIDKLSAFIDKGIKVDSLHIKQLSIMKEYALILENRLEDNVDSILEGLDSNKD